MSYKAIFKIGDKDFTHLVLEGAIAWSRNDIDSSSTGRSQLDATMIRKRLAIKRKLTVKCRRMDMATLIALNQALLPETIQVTYLDAIVGETTKTFYGSSVEATTQITIGDETYWENTSFSLIEV